MIYDNKTAERSLKMRSIKKFRAEPFLQLALLLVLLAEFSAVKTKKPEGVGPHEDYGARAEIVLKDIPYAQAVPGAEKLKLDVYSNPHQGLWPTVVMIHGGAWIGGDKSMDNKVYICQVLAKNGYVAFNINYRLAPDFPIKLQVEDCLAALLWIKEHGREYGADPERIAVVGGSAGGHLAALLAWNPQDPWFIPTGQEQTAAIPRLKAAALYYPVIDLDLTLKQNAGAFDWLAHLLFTGEIGKTYMRQLEHISPVKFIKPDNPPTLFLTGDADELHLYPQSRDAAQELKQLGVDSQLFTAAGKKHGFTWQYWDQATVESAQAVVSFFDKYLK